MSSRPIGVFDSGIGGLTVVSEILRLLPGENLVYFGDTARVPYGTKSDEAVLRFSRQTTRFLLDRDVKMIVLACNTASAVALERLEEEIPVPVLGVIEPGARAAVKATRKNVVGVIGTPATIRSGSYERAIRVVRGNGSIRVLQDECPLFVPLAEEGWTEGEVAEATARRYLEPLREAGVDALVLGCTHYPILKPVIGRVMGPEVRLVDSAEETALEVRERLQALSLVNGAEGSGSLRVYVSDIPHRFREEAERFLGRPLEHVEQVDPE
jgi:glutamate racemase